MKIIKTKRIFRDKGIYDDRHLYKKRKGLFQTKPKADEYSIDSSLNIEYLSGESQNDHLSLDNTVLSKPVQNTVLEEIALTPDIADVVVSFDVPALVNRPAKTRASRGDAIKGRFREQPSYNNPEVVKSFYNSFAEPIIDIRQGDSTEKHVKAQSPPNIAVDQTHTETPIAVTPLSQADFANDTEDAASPEALQTQVAATETPTTVTPLSPADFSYDTDDASPEALQTQVAATETPTTVTPLSSADFSYDTEDAPPEVLQTKVAATETPTTVTPLSPADFAYDTEDAPPEMIQDETVGDAAQIAANQMHMPDLSEKARQEIINRLIAKKRLNRLTGNVAIAASGLLLITALIAAIVWMADIFL